MTSTMEKSNYFSILKQLHDTCRNNPAPKLTGMDAYNEIINYLQLRHTSDHNEDDILKKLYIDYCTDAKIEEDKKNQDLKHSKIGTIHNFNYMKLSRELLPRLIKREENKSTAFVKILGNTIHELSIDIGRLTNIVHIENGNTGEHGKKAQMIINKMYQPKFLPLDKSGKFDFRAFPYDALGEGFEKFMNDAGSRGGNWGQYFTNIQIIDWLCDQVSISPTDKIIDPFAGSGGFILQIKKKFNIPSENLYGQEYDDKIFKFLKFNSKIANLTQDNIVKGDSFDYYETLRDSKEKFDIVMTNPPFGESISILLDKEKKQYWDVLKTGKETIKNSMGLSCLVIINSLKMGGQAAFVAERGVMNNCKDNNSWQKRLRKYMMETCNITQILLLPKGIFTHTTFDTACIVLTKGTKTKNITFHKGEFLESDKGQSNKQMKISELMTVSIEQIVNNDWSLDFQDYQEKVVEKGLAGIPMMPLGEVCEFLNGERITKTKHSVPKSESSYPVYGGGDITFYTPKCNRDAGTLIIGRFGVSPKCVRIVQTKFWLHDNGMSIKNKDIIQQQFLHMYLICIQKEIFSCCISNAQARMELSKLKKLLIPVPSMEHQQEIVNTLDPLVQQDIGVLDAITKDLHQYNIFNLLLLKRYDDFHKVLQYRDQLNVLKTMMKSLKTDHYENQKKACFQTVPYTMMPLGEVCEFQNGDKLTRKEMENNNGTYPVYGGGNKIIGHSNKYNFENTIIINRVGTGLGKDHKNTCVKYITNKFYGTENMFGVTLINDNYMKYKYLYYQLHMSQNKWKCKAGGQAQSVITKSTLKKLLIPVPSIQDQHKVIEMIESIDEQSSNYQKAIQGNLMMIKMVQDSIETITHGTTLPTNDTASSSETNVNDNQNASNDTNVLDIDVMSEVDSMEESSDSDDSMNVLPDDFKSSTTLSATQSSSTTLSASH